MHLLHGVDNSVEVSFASKLIATVSPEEPIWDKYVLKNLGFDKECGILINQAVEKFCRDTES